jgi:hypothetical protein
MTIRLSPQRRAHRAFTKGSHLGPAAPKAPALFPKADFMCEVLLNVNALGPFPSADDVVAPFDTCLVAFDSDFDDWRVSRGWEACVHEKRTKVDDVHGRRRRGVILRFGCRQRCRLLLRLLVDRSSVVAVDGACCRAASVARTPIRITETIKARVVTAFLAIFSV